MGSKIHEIKDQMMKVKAFSEDVRNRDINYHIFVGNGYHRPC